MKRMKKKITSMLNAITFAEAGEFDSALELLPKSGAGKVVLFVTDSRRPESDAFDHAVNLCKRIGAELEIVSIADHFGSVESNDIPSSTNERFSELFRLAGERNVRCTISVLSGKSSADLSEYFHNHRKVAAIIYGYHDGNRDSGPDSNLIRKLEKIVQTFSIPLVKVLERRSKLLHQA